LRWQFGEFTIAALVHLHEFALAFLAHQQVRREHTIKPPLNHFIIPKWTLLLA
jgi:hypothetical protein